MKFQASYFNISWALVRENMRRFWPVPVIGFLAYFLSSAFPILMNYKHLDIMAYYIKTSLENMQPFFMISHLLLPILSAVMVFRYLHGISSVSVLHAMPFTRTSLFGSHFLSGLLLSVSPVLANGFILLLISKPVPYTNSIYDSVTGPILTEINAFSRLSICTWMLESFVVILFIFTVAVFAGMVAGNGLMHFFLALSFNFLLPLLYLTFLSYFHQYLYGFSYAGFSTEFGLKLSPYLYVFTDGGLFSVGSIACYLLAVAVIAFASLLLYRKRKLERATDSLVFSFLEPIICFLITFFAMYLFGLYFVMLEDTTLYRIGGYAAGSIIGFLIGQMIVKKTVRVFNFNSLKHFAIYGVIATLFFVGLTFDATGYERRVPMEADIASISFETSNYVSDSNNARMFESDTSLPYQTVENIKLIRRFHEDLISKKNVIEATEINQRYDMVNLTYHLKNGNTLSRSYDVSVPMLRKETLLKPFFESSEYRKGYRNALTFLEKNQLNYVVLSPYTNYASTSENATKSTTISDEAFMHRLIQALSKDINARTYEELTFRAIPLAVLEFGFDRPNNSADKPAAKDSSSIYLLPSYQNTIDFLTEQGHGKFLTANFDNTAYMLVEYVSNDTGTAPWTAEMTTLPIQPPKSDSQHLVTTDKEKMTRWFSSCETETLTYSSYYNVTVVYPDVEGSTSYEVYTINSDRVSEEIRTYFQ